MGLFKIFRKKKPQEEVQRVSSDVAGSNNSPPRGKGTQKKLEGQTRTQTSSGPGVGRSSTSGGTKNQVSGPNAPSSNAMGFHSSPKSEPQVVSPSNHSGGAGSLTQSTGSKNQLGSAQTEIGINHSSSGGSSPRLSQQQLHRFDLQNSSSGNNRNSQSHGIGRPMYTMSDMSPGQLEAMDDMDRSDDASSSSFNLSTDAEDSEYETLRRRGVLPIARPRSTVDNSVLSAIAAPSPYSGETEEERLYPSLRAIEPILAETKQAKSPEKRVLSPVTSRQPMPPTSPGNKPFSPTASDDEPERILPQHRVSPPKQTQAFQPPNSRTNMYAVDAETDYDMRAWGVSPADSSSIEPVSSRSAHSQGNPAFNFEDRLSSRHKGDDHYGFTPRGSPGPVDPPATTTSQSTASRNFTSPKKHVPETTGFTSDPDFADFVDFNTFGNNAFASVHKDRSLSDPASPGTAWREEKKMQEITERRSIPLEPYGFDEGLDSATSPKMEKKTFNASANYAHSSPGVTDTSLSELLAQAKNKQKRANRLRSSRASSSSVNSAPSFSASFLRQHHNLGAYSKNSDPNDRSSSEGGASVSDIILSLEATNQSRLKAASRVSYGHRSVGDSGVVSTARAVKERLREKRRQERESGSSLNRSSELSSSDNSDNEASESWLLDEVTGALGPRGIAADLESLSGRSNRSKESRGNVSHISRSRRLRQSSSRKAKSSGDSVDSRTSRYSHRSTKSFLSQMSEQSRSVANDLLRLEMQLAMVGNMDKQDEGAGRATTTSGPTPATASTATTGPGASSWTNRSSSSGVAPWKSNATPRSPTQGSPMVSPTGSQATRNTLNVLAPPGKLGIILANKADSSGTVVSGVRTSSPLVDKIMPGDRLVAIDGEDVSRMSVSEITAIMGRKAEYERTLTVLTAAPKHLDQYQFAGTNNKNKSDGANYQQQHHHQFATTTRNNKQQQQQQQQQQYHQGIHTTVRSPSQGHSSGTDPFDTAQFGQFRH